MDASFSTDEHTRRAAALGRGLSASIPAHGKVRHGGTRAGVLLWILEPELIRS
jgi:hypothetical protein